MARPGRKKRTALFIVEIICLLLFIGGLYVYGQIDSRLNKIETPQLDESKIVTNVTAPQMSGYTTYALFGSVPRMLRLMHRTVIPLSLQVSIMIPKR